MEGPSGLQQIKTQKVLYTPLAGLDYLTPLDWKKKIELRTEN